MHLIARDQIVLFYQMFILFYNSSNELMNKIPESTFKIFYKHISQRNHCYKDITQER